MSLYEKYQPLSEAAINAAFDWGGQRWHVPAIYPWEEGLVIDICAEVEPEQIHAFLEKWLPLAKQEDAFTDEQREQMTAENPLNMDFRPQAMANGAPLPQDSTSRTLWNPCLRDEVADHAETKALLKHYSLDPAKGREKQHTVCSALHFAPVDTVEWRMTFRHKFVDDIRIELI